MFHDMAACKVQFIVQPLPAKEKQFKDKLQVLSGKRSFYAQLPEDVPPVLQQLQQYNIKQCVVGPKHLAFLLQDGKVCRLKYAAQDSSAEEVETSNATPSSSAKSSSKIGERPAKVPRTGSSPWIISGADLSSNSSPALRRWGTHIGVIRSMASSSSGISSLTTSSSTSSRSRGRNSGPESTGVLGSGSAGVRLVRTSQLRGRGLQGSLLSGQRVIVPASHVPEELVNQVQGILQGKSRNIIIRELQRTNLDVNLAVNNLLSRDDEDNDDVDDNGNEYMPGEDLLSLLDSGIHPGEHGVFIDTDVLPEELLGYTLHRSSRTSASQRGGNCSGSENTSSGGRDSLLDRDPIIRLRGHRFFEPLCSYESDQDESSQQSKSGSSAEKKSAASKKSMSVNLADGLEWWMEDDNYVEFSQIGAMQSELAAIDTSGSLRQWRWTKNIPYRHSTNPKIFHPRTQFLCVEDKKIFSLATCALRASVLVEMGGVATWIDESVARHASVLEHPVTSCIDPSLVTQLGTSMHESMQTRCLHVCSLYTAVFTPLGDIYWWGVLPFHLRKKILETSQIKLKKTLSVKKSSTSKEVKVGSLVCLNSCPLYQSGAIAIHTRSGKPKIGCLQQSVWNLTEKYTFNVLKRKGKKCKSKTKEKKPRGKDSGFSAEATQDNNTLETAEKTSVIQSNSERETVLKSTAALVEPDPSSKPQKRKLTASTQKPVGHSDNNMDDDAGWYEEGEDIKEQWHLQDVIIIEDLQTVPVGKVIKVDGNVIGVLFRKPGKSLDEKITKKSVLKNMRLLRKEDVHVLASNSPPKVPECILKTPRKILLDPSIKIHSICVNEVGIEAMEGGLDGRPFQYITINMLGKVTADALPTPPELFFGNDFKQTHDGITNKEVCKLDKNCQDFATIFRDRNDCLYPLLRNENSGIRDPTWLNLPPVNAVGMGVHSQTNLRSSENKAEHKMLLLTALVFKSYTLTPLIIHRDHKSVEELLNRATEEELQAICAEQCDGQRNIFHVAVSATVPTSNQNSEDEEEESTSNKKGLKKGENYRPHAQPASASSSPSVVNTTSENVVPSASESSTQSSSAQQESSSAHAMSQSERLDAVNAIANAISVVTRGERTMGDARSEPGVRDQQSPRTSSSDPFVMALPPPQYRPLAALPSLSSSGFSSRFMRDIMQQFAAVLDDHPTSSTSSAPSTTSSTTTSRRAPAVIQEALASGGEELMETLPAARRPSPTPAIPTSTWPPVPEHPLFRQRMPSNAEGLNLSIEKSDSDSVQQNSKSAGKRLKRKRSLTPSSDIPKPKQKRGTQSDGISIIKLLCFSKVLEPNLLSLLSQRDLLGHTPFMSAIYHRAYPAAMEIFECSLTVAKNRYSVLYPNENVGSNLKFKEILMQMMFPSDSHPDANPLYVLCSNDTCSFTWTGAQHINQDIFECWTCGLTGTLCCCSECARVCHNGHDCKLKRTSPTAYCDCWEKCACRALVAGDTNARTALLQKLMQETDLVDLANARGETILQFLAQTVARQTIEQRQHRNRGSSAKSSRPATTTMGGEECEVPQHDLQPPTFCKEAFMTLLREWNSVRSTIMSNSLGRTDPLCASSAVEMSANAASFLSPDEKQCMMSQTGTSRLDSFVLCLLVKCNTMYLDVLLETFINQMQKTNLASDKDEDLEVVHRFVRSLVRVFVILSICSSSENYVGKPMSRSLSNVQPLKRVQRAFNALLPMAVKELCEMATALIDPVRLGISRPTSPFTGHFSSTDIIHSCETAFARIPFPPRHESKEEVHREGRRKHDGHRRPFERQPMQLSREFSPRQGPGHLTSQTSTSSISPRTMSAPQENESVDERRGEEAESGMEDALTDDSVSQRPHESIIAESVVSHPYNNDDDNDEEREWENEEEPENAEQEREEDGSQISVAVEEGQAEVGHDGGSGEERPAEQVEESHHDVISEGDLDMDDEDAEPQEEIAPNDQDEEESYMDLTLLSGSEADTDAGSDQSGEEDNNDEAGDGNHPHVMYFEDDEEMSEDIADDDADNDEDDEVHNDDDDDDEEDRDAYTKASEDEAATATEPEDEEESDDEARLDDDGSEREMDAQSEWVELPLERASTRMARSRAAMAPHSMRWALGGFRNDSSRSGTGASSGRPAGPVSGSAPGALIYLDPLSIRRASNTVASSSVTPVGSSSDPGKQNPSPSNSAATTNSELARAFSICVREVAKLLLTVWRGDHVVNVPLNTFLELSYEDVETLRKYAEETLSVTWRWLLTIVDSNEAQLRFGQVLSLVGSPEHPDHPLHKGTGKSSKGNGTNAVRSPMERRGAIATFPGSTYARTGREISVESSGARQDFLSYALSLMRAHSGEHADYLPVMDVSSLRHIAYVLDSLVFYLRETSCIQEDNCKESKKKHESITGQNPSSLNIGYDNTDDENEDMEASSKESSTYPDELYSLAVSDVLVGDIIARAKDEVNAVSPYAHPPKAYFRRSESMTCLGCTDSDLFHEPLVKALPLADKPHLLQPNARKEELFGRPQQLIVGDEDPSYFDANLPGTGMGLLRHKLNTKMQKLKETQAKAKKKDDAEPSTRVEKHSEMKISSVEKSDASESTHTDTQPACEMEAESIDSSLLAGPSKSVIVNMEKTKKDESKSDAVKTASSKKTSFVLPSVDSLLSRCRLTLELFSKVFLNDVGLEPKSILQELGGFEVREAKFRKEMEKLRNSQSVDLQLNVERDPHRLILQTFKQLNQHYRRKTGASTLSASAQPLAVQRVKVVFKDEPGEGSGVARSFYTVLCEALLSSDKLPPLDGILVSIGSTSVRHVSESRHRLIPRIRRREQERLGRAGGKKVNLRSYFMERYAQQSASLSSVSTPSHFLTQIPPFFSQSSASGRSEHSGSVDGRWSRYKRAIGERLLPKVNAISPSWSEKITGMLLSLPVAELLLLLSSENMLRIKVNDASRRLAQIQYNGEEEQPTSSSKDGQDLHKSGRSSHRGPRGLASSSSPFNKNKGEGNQESDSDQESEDEELDMSTFPLFYQPGKQGFYSPAACPKRMSKLLDSDPTKKQLPLGYEARLNAFRNVGRIIGLCLLQNELCPLPLNRHVLKVLLGRKINWHDFAFFDPVLYESLRYMLDVCSAPEGAEILESLDIYYVVDSEQDLGEVELIPSGSTTSVTPQNVHDYVRRYTMYRMISCCYRYLDQMREGLFDVLPRSAMDSLTAEDLRLLLNGCGRVNVRMLISYTSFNDESGKSAGPNTEKLTEFKRWFWSVIERMSHASRQELLYFWTGSPALPASEDGFQPLPTVTIRPPDDQHLPTANTCISRLYVPLYSSKAVLKQKLMMAIQTKNFGFV